jgi:uncharacterized protein
LTIDCHVHIAATTAAQGSISESLLKSVAFHFLRWRLHMGAPGPEADRRMEAALAGSLQEAPELDAAAVLAFDAVYDAQGALDSGRTHFYVSNDYVIELCRRHPKMLFGASIHPRRKDALAELERCVRAGAVLVKWLPITQDFSPAEECCIPFYEALAAYKLPLLSHTGWENLLPQLNRTVADPALLEPALKRGVKVIGAHCGTRSRQGDVDFVPTFLRMAREYEHFYGDTAALNLPTRSYAYESILSDAAVRAKLVHGSDWPIVPIPPATRLGVTATTRLLGEGNWLRRDVLIKRELGLDDEYFGRAAKVLGIPR